MKSEKKTEKSKINNLLDLKDIEFERATDIQKTVTEDFIKLVRMKMKENAFDNFDYKVKKSEKKIENKLILDNEDPEIDRKEIEDLFLEIKNELNRMTSVNNIWCDYNVEIVEKKVEEKQNNKKKAKKIKHR